MSLSIHLVNKYLLSCSKARVPGLLALSHFTAKQGKPGSGGASEARRGLGPASLQLALAARDISGSSRATGTVSSASLANVYKTFSYAVNDPY